MRTMQRNKRLTAELLDISSKNQAIQCRMVEATDVKGKLDQAKEETLVAMKRWRMMKSVVAAVIAGSGIDWAQYETFRDLVLDSENEAT